MEGQHLFGYDFLELLGSGGYATVWRCRHQRTGNAVAIKVVPKELLDSEQKRNQFMREIHIMRLVNHPFIVRIYEFCETEYAYFVVMELIQGKNLYQYLEKGAVNESIARKYFCQLMIAIEYLHNTILVIHRDIKAENVVIDKNNNIKLIDFGFSTFMQNEDSTFNTRCGSLCYSPPEMVKGNSYSKPADIWSAGIILYTLCHGQLPFFDKDTQECLQKIAFSEPNYLPSLSSAYVDLVQKLLVKIPAARITIPQIKKHPWFSQTEYSVYMKMVDQYTKNLNNCDSEVRQIMKSLGFNVENIGDPSKENINAVYEILMRKKCMEESPSHPMPVLEKTTNSFYRHQAFSAPIQAPQINTKRMERKATRGAFMPMRTNNVLIAARKVPKPLVHKPKLSSLA